MTEAEAVGKQLESTDQALDKYWRDKLQCALDSSIDELAAIESELTATRALRANGGDDDEHDPDGIPLSSTLQLLEGQKVRTLNQIRATESALEDLAQGRHGICRKCLRRIPSHRLEIKPTTGTCVKCAR